jgi:diguanylate cyclase (GGDEF)-like protein/PAS domain S-box-containing protein
MSSPKHSGRISRPAAPDRAGTLVALAEALFDEITREASQICESSAAALSLVEDGHHWFKLRGGVSPAETPRAIALCAETIRRKDVLTLADVRHDARFREGPEDPKSIRFFTGVPIVTARSGAIGTLSVMDVSARVLAVGQLASLAELAREAARQFDIRLGANEVLARVPAAESDPAAEAGEPEFRQLVEHLPLGTYLIQDGRYRYANPKLADILGYAQPELVGADVATLVVDGDRANVLGRIREGLAGAASGPYTFQAIRKDGELIDVEVHETGTEIDGRAALIGSLLDVTDRKRAEAQVSERAFVDSLTRLPNRVRFMERLETELAQSRRYDRKLAVVHLDLDAFKFVNDNWGHNVGDKLLQSLALRLTRGVREVDTIARIGADEFLVLVPDLRQGEDLSRFAQKLLSLTSRPVDIDERTLQVTASVGVATYPDDGQDAESLLRNADAAMYRAKDLGGNNFELCTPELTAMAVERLELQSGLRQALDRDELLLHYQPLVSISTGRMVGLEALVRWQHPVKGFLPPVTFIPVAEESGLILPLGEWVLRAATSQLKVWHSTGLDLRISVNFSAKQFRERSLVHTVEDALSSAGLEPRHLEVEITESIAMEGAEIVNANLNLLRSMGVGIAIDDFGTGYSSMSYLKSFPITSLKIDRSFVTDLAENAADAGIVRAIVEMAHGSRLGVIAEGVETQDQFQLLQKYGCDEMQGYWVSRPLPIDGVDRKLQEELALWRQGT